MSKALRLSWNTERNLHRSFFQISNHPNLRAQVRKMAQKEARCLWALEMILSFLKAEKGVLLDACQISLKLEHERPRNACFHFVESVPSEMKLKKASNNLSDKFVEIKVHASTFIDISARWAPNVYTCCTSSCKKYLWKSWRVSWQYWKNLKYSWKAILSTFLSAKLSREASPQVLKRKNVKENLNVKVRKKFRKHKYRREGIKKLAFSRTSYMSVLPTSYLLSTETFLIRVRWETRCKAKQINP